MKNIKNLLNKFFLYNEPKNIYNFALPKEQILNDDIPKENIELKCNLDLNLKYLKEKYSYDINSDIIFRNFTLTIKNKKITACLIFIDGMVNSELVNNFILRPLMMAPINPIKYDAKKK